MIFLAIFDGMEDYKWILYIIAAVYFILKSRKKKVAPPRVESEPFESTQNSPKPVTFEDLLKEIQQSKAPAPRQEFKPVTKTESFKFPKYEDYDDNLEDESKDLEKVDKVYKEREAVYATYEKAKQEAFNRPSLEESMDAQNNVIRFGKFKDFEQDRQQNLLEKYTINLRDIDELKKALVMAEILNRKF